MIATILDDICHRYGQLPSAVLKEDAHLLLRMRAILNEASDDG